MMKDKRIRQLVIAILTIIVALGVLSLISTVVQLMVPLAILAVGGFAFYKIVLEGRDQPAAMEDEVAESSGMAVGDAAALMESAGDAPQKGAEARLSAVEQARKTYVDTMTPAEEILDQLKSRKERLQGDSEA